MIGIYKILNLKNNKCYIGQSKNIEKRINKHKNLLIKNNHYNNFLQNSWNKYGEDNFRFEIVELCKENELNNKEIYWIQFYKSLNKKYGYNQTSGGDGLKNYKHTEKTKEKISIQSKKFKLSPEHKQKLIKSITGRKKSKEELEKLSKAAKGRKISEWHKQRLKEGRKNYIITDEVKQKISNSRKGFKMSEEQKKKLSEINKGKPSPNKKLTDIQIEEIKNIFINNEYQSVKEIALKYNVGTSTIYGIRKQTGIKPKKIVTDEQKQKISKKLKGRKLSEEHKLKISLNHASKNLIK